MSAPKTYRAELSKLAEFSGYAVGSLEYAAAGHEGPKVAKFAARLLEWMAEHGYIAEAEMTEAQP